MNTRTLGKLGEEHAARFLISQNYHIIETNFYCRYGELDLVALDLKPRNSSHPQLVFIEVKTRTSDTFGEPQDALTHRKRQKILKTALHFIQQVREKLGQGQFGNLPSSWRIDLIAVKLDRNLKLKAINHFKTV